MYVDAHCHLDFPAFDADRAAVLERARAVGVTQVVVAGVCPADWPRQRALAGPDVAWTAGLHPLWVPDEVDLAPAFEGDHPACAVGEIGLDKRADLAPQIPAFRDQLAFARDRDLPVVLHVVGAHGKALEIARADGLPRALVHGFTGSPEVAAQWLALGAHIGFGGAIARPNAKKARAAIATVPQGRLLLETDAPDQPLPGQERNEPAALVDIARHAADLRGEDAGALLRAAAANARALFGLRQPDTSWQSAPEQEGP